MRWHLHLATLSLLFAAVFWPGESLADPGRYVVRKGDSLSIIAKRFGCDVATLKQDNRLTDTTLLVGQELEIKRPFSGRGAPAFKRPFAKKGRVLESFGPRHQNKVTIPRSGVKMACALGSPVTAPAHAVVRYVGWMDDYGTIVILEHGGGFHTVLAPLDPASVEVAVGEAVLAGDMLGRTTTPPQKGLAPYLHLELRKNQKAVDPARLLK
jgi:septal ring factor EnvC (AmiA/AmiB activator)